MTHDPILVMEYQSCMIKEGLLSYCGLCFCEQGLCIARILLNAGLHLVAQKALSVFIRLPMLHYKSLEEICLLSPILGLYLCGYYH